MTQILGQCPTCNGTRAVPHVRRALLDGEIPNPNDLDRYKTDDICPACGGGGTRPIDIQITEPPKADEQWIGC